jgi:hypothetical protein
MEIRRRCLIFILGLIPFVFSSCSSSNHISALSDGESLPSLETIIPTSGHYELSSIDPVPLGSKASLGRIEFVVVDLVRPATQQVVAASSANPIPEEGMEYVLVDIIATCATPVHLECWVKDHEMRLIGSTGIERRPQYLAGIDQGLHHLLGSAHLRGGGAAFGWVPFIVDQSEEDLVFYYQMDTDKVVYLATE